MVFQEGTLKSGLFEEEYGKYTEHFSKEKFMELAFYELLTDDCLGALIARQVNKGDLKHYKNNIYRHGGNKLTPTPKKWDLKVKKSHTAQDYLNKVNKNGKHSFKYVACSQVF